MPQVRVMKWLVTGGAGYIGSHVVWALRASGREVVVLDDLSTGVSERIDGIPLIRQSIVQDPHVLMSTLKAHNITGVAHLAAKKVVHESTLNPLYYYEQNVTGTLNLVHAAVRAGVECILYSSSAAVYGEVDITAVDEDQLPAPSNPYGGTKLAAEWIVREAAHAHRMRCVALRYFNVAGAADPRLADYSVHNLLPSIVSKARAGELVSVFGGDWPTIDGSCVRDYVHVADVARAHLASIEGMERGKIRNRVFNVGRGVGVSVLEMIAAVERAIDRPIRYRIVGRRPGDPSTVLADTTRIQSELGWCAALDLDDIVTSTVASLWRERDIVTAASLLMSPIPPVKLWV